MKRRKNIRRDVMLTMAVTTLVVFTLFITGMRLRDSLPQRQEEMVRAALDAGDVAGARALMDRYLSDEQRSELSRAADYAEADALFARGEWEAARRIFAVLADYADSEERARLCIVALGDDALSKKDFEEAAAYYERATAYEKADDARYLQAEDIQEKGDLTQALRMFLALGDHLDSRTRASALATALTGEADPEKALAMAETYSETDLARREAMLRRRAALPGAVLDVGFYHTVGLRADGTVAATGDNTYGQCDVADWTDIVAVSAGAYHTVGLRKDGTVVAAGRDTENQCLVSGWTGVVQIAAADYATFALLADGTVAYTGFNDCSEVDGWTGVRYITAGSYSLGALRSGGTALISHLTARSDTLRDLVGLTVNTAFAVGLRKDGTVVSPAVDLSGWEDIAALSSSGTAILGLRADGTVAARFFHPADDPGIAQEQNVIAMAAGGTHFAFLHADGTVTVLGGTGRGETDTDQWLLDTTPAES